MLQERYKMKIIFSIFFILSFVGLFSLGAYGEIIFSYTLGKQGTGINEFQKPTGIAIFEGRIYVAEFTNERIQVLDLNGDFLSFIELDGNAHGIEVMDNQIFVGVWSNESHVDVFNIDGERTARIFGFVEPGDIAIGVDGSIYVADYGTGIIKKFNSKNQLLSEIHTVKNLYEKKSKLTGIAIDSGGNLYVSDHFSDRVMKLNSKGEFLMEFDLPVENGDVFVKPTSIEINNDDEIFICNRDRVLIFNTNGEYLSEFGESGKGNGQFKGPHGLAFDENGSIYVADFRNHRIQVFTSYEEFNHEQVEVFWFSKIIDFIRSIFWLS